MIRTERMDYYVGKRVKLARAITTRGGNAFAAGLVFHVAGHHRGRLSLNRPSHRGRALDPRLCLRKVDFCDVELVEDEHGRL